MTSSSRSLGCSREMASAILRASSIAYDHAPCRVAARAGSTSSPKVWYLRQARPARARWRLSSRPRRSKALPLCVGRLNSPLAICRSDAVSVRYTRTSCSSQSSSSRQCREQVGRIGRRGRRPSKARARTILVSVDRLAEVPVAVPSDTSIRWVLRRREIMRVGSSRKTEAAGHVHMGSHHTAGRQ